MGFISFTRVDLAVDGKGSQCQVLPLFWALSEHLYYRFLWQQVLLPLKEEDKLIKSVALKFITSEEFNDN